MSRSDKDHVRRFGTAITVGAALLCGCADEPLKAEEFRALVAKGDVSAVARAAKEGLDLDQLDRSGYSALSLSSFNGHIEVVRELLKHGAETDLGYAHLRPLPMAVSQGQHEVVKLLIAHGAKLEYEDGVEQPLAFASDPEVIRTLVAAGAKVNAVGGATRQGALHLCSGMGRSDSVKLLLELGANPNLADSNGSTPLHRVCRIRSADLQAEGPEGPRQVLRLLLKAGAKADAQDRNGSTPLHFAARSRVFGPEELKLLIAAGAPLTHKNAFARTPLEQAMLAGLSKDEPRIRLLRGK